MNDVEIIELIKKNPEYNFFAVAVTPWHAHGVDVAIKRLTAEGKKLKGVIFAIVHPGSPRCINQCNFVSVGTDIKVMEVDFEQKGWIQKLIFNLNAYFLLRKYRKKQFENSIYVVRPSYPDFNWINYIRKVHNDKEIVFISVDEGCGSYIVGKKANWINAMMAVEGQKGVLKKYLLSVLAFPRKLIRDSITKELVRKEAFQRWNLLAYNENMELIPDEKNVPFYKQVLQEQAFEINMETGKLYQDVVLINTSPSYEEGKIKEDEDIKTLELATNILKEKDLPIVIKTHPRECAIERYESLPCVVNTIGGVSQETIIGKLKIKPKCIISINSTTLVTLKVLYDIPAVGLTKLYMQKNTDETERQALQNFVDTFRNIVMFPESEAELRECLKNIL